jgi:hypothetical protein
MIMKILVVSSFDIKRIFSEPSKHDFVYVSPEGALRVFLEESPDVVMVFAEYETNLFEKAREALKDIKNSAPKGVKIFRLGFLKERKNDGETYLRLPLSLPDENLDKILA